MTFQLQKNCQNIELITSTSTFSIFFPLAIIWTAALQKICFPIGIEIVHTLKKRRDPFFHLSAQNICPHLAHVVGKPLKDPWGV